MRVVRLHDASPPQAALGPAEGGLTIEEFAA